MLIPPEAEGPIESGRTRPDDSRWFGYLESFRGDLRREARRGLGADLGARLDASDVVQETMLRAVRALRGFRGQTTRELRGWVQAIMATSLTDARRHHRSAARRGVGREVPMVAVPECAEAGETPSRLMIHSEQKAAMMLALLGLSERDQAALTLRYDEGLSFVEIGRRLDLSDEAARKLCNRALDRLRRAMGGERSST